jgi:hypothetical protein
VRESRDHQPVTAGCYETETLLLDVVDCWNSGNLAAGYLLL